MLIAGIFIIYFLFFKDRKTADIFRGVELNRVLKDRLDGTIKIINETEVKFGTLRRGRTTIGRIKRHGIVLFENDKPLLPWEYKKKKDKDGKEKPTTKFKKLHIFEIATGQGMIAFIKELLHMDFETLLIPDHLVKGYSVEAGDKIITYYSLKQDIDIVSFGSVYLYGLDSFDYIKGQAWLYGREKELEELINYPKRAVFLDTKHAKHTEELEKIYALDEKRRKGYMDSMLPGGSRK